MSLCTKISFSSQNWKKCHQIKNNNSTKLLKSGETAKLPKSGKVAKLPEIKKNVKKRNIKISRFTITSNKFYETILKAVRNLGIHFSPNLATLFR